MSTDFSGMIAFAQSLAETVKQAQTATEELAATRKQLAEMQGHAASLEATLQHRQADFDHLHTDYTATAQALEDAKRQQREVSEALAAANAKLNTFRDLLGLDSGTGAPVPTPAVLPEQPTHAVAEPPHEAQPVDPAPAPGTGGVEPRDPYAGVTIQGEPFSDRSAETEAQFGSNHVLDAVKSEPTQSPEVAEPRPTPPQTGGSHEPSSGPMDDRFGQAQEARPFDTTTGSTPSASSEGGPISWRDSASHVPYRAFSC